MSCEKKFYVYLHKRPDGSIFYVGKGSGKRYQASLAKRAWNLHYKNIVKKYGAENIGVEIHYCLSEEDALEKEIECIRYLRENGARLCNLTDGGDGVSGYRHTDAANEANRVAHIGKRLSDEHKAKVSRSLIGNKRSLGIKQTPEANSKRSAALKGRTWKHRHPMSAEQRAIRSAALKGRAWSASRRAAQTAEVSEKLRKAARIQNQNRDAATGVFTR